MNDGPIRGRKPWEPWTAYMEAGAGLTIASPTNTEPICRVSGYLQPVVANARLIAAAPALLAALERLMRTPIPIDEDGRPWADLESDWTQAWNQARAAIRLATGEQG